MRLFKSEISKNSRESSSTNESHIPLQDLLKIWRSDFSDLQSKILNFIATIEILREDLNPLILFCAQRGYADAIKQLHLYGVDVYVPDAQGNTALHEACHKDQLAVVETLLSFHDKPVQNLDGQTPAHYAVMSSSIDVLTLLIPYHYLDRADNKGDSPLHWAAADGKTDVISFLIENGASINKNGQNKWPWELAYSNNPEDISSINLFLSISLKNDTPASQEFFSWLFKGDESKNLLNLLRSNGVYPVHMLASLGKINILKSLGSKHFNESDNEDELPLHNVIKTKNINQKETALFLFEERFLKKTDDLSLLKSDLPQLIQILNFAEQHDEEITKELFRFYFKALIKLCENAHIKRQMFFENPLGENERSYAEAVFSEQLPTALKLLFAIIKKLPGLNEECFILLEALFERLRNEKKRSSLIQKVLSSLYELNPERATNIELDLLHRQGAVILLLARTSILLSDKAQPIAVKDVVKVKLAELLLANFYTGDSFAKTWLSEKIHERLKRFPEIDPRIKMDDILSHPYFQYLRAIQALEYLNNCSHKFSSDLRARCNKVLANASGSQLMEESEEHSWTEAAMTISILDGMNRIKHSQQEVHFLKTLTLLDNLHDFIEGIIRSKNKSPKENNLNPAPSAPPLEAVEQDRAKESPDHQSAAVSARKFESNSSEFFVFSTERCDDASPSEASVGKSSEKDASINMKKY